MACSGAASSAAAVGVGALVGGKVGDREVGFVADPADHRDRAGTNGACNAFVVEGPEIFDAASTAADNEDVAITALARCADRVGDLCCGAVTLHRGGVEHDADMRRATGQGAQNVAQRSGLRRGDDADTPREGGKRAFGRTGEKPFTLQPVLELQKFFVEIADAGSSCCLDIQLEIAARLVKRDEYPGLDVLAVFQSPAENLRTVAEHHTAHLGGGILQRKIDVAGTGAAQV